MYFQETLNKSGGLKLIPGSHKSSIYKIAHFIKKIPLVGFFMFFFMKYVAIYFKFYTKNVYPIGINLNMEPTDLFVWNMLTSHSGNVVKLKMLPNLNLPPFIERIIPKSWRLQGNQERMTIFAHFALPGKIFNHYLNWRKSLEGDIRLWESSIPWDKKLIEDFLDRGITLHKPIESHGQKYVS